jgi:hypothetical protein
MGFTPSPLKNGRQNAVLLWCMLQAGPPSLDYYCAIVLHSCIILSAILQTISITVVNLQDNRAVFRIFMALFRFPFDSPSYYLCVHYSLFCFFPPSCNIQTNSHATPITLVLHPLWYVSQSDPCFH